MPGRYMVARRRVLGAVLWGFLDTLTDEFAPYAVTAERQWPNLVASATFLCSGVTPRGRYSWFPVEPEPTQEAAA
ncbi:hypothetical protein [Agromyces sp. SYSU T00194]|uniref:hypothetical protein n=1 Tax=Agromyces chitinivorans TaxID=3158560 RepID=UPI003390B295